jgi:hypothetical protein
MANKASAKIRARSPAPKRDTIPNPEDLPSDEPEGTTPSIGGNTGAGQKKK